MRLVFGIVFLSMYVGAVPPWLDSLTDQEQRALSNYCETRGIKDFTKTTHADDILEMSKILALFEEEGLSLGSGTFKESVQKNNSLKEASKTLSTFVIGASAAVANSFLFTDDQNIGHFLFPGQIGVIDASSVGIPVAIFTAIPFMYSLEDSSQWVRWPTRHDLTQSKLKILAYLINAGFSAQAAYNALLIYGNVAWNSRRESVRNSVNEGSYILAGSFVLATFLDSVNNGIQLINRVQNEYEARLNKDHLGRGLKESIARQIQDQLMLGYQTLQNHSDEELLQLRALIGGLHKKASTEEEKQQARLATVSLLLMLNGSEETEWTPYKKPTSLVAAEWAGGILGGAVLPWAIFSYYWFNDEDNRYVPGEGYTTTPLPLHNWQSWLYALPLASYTAVTGFFNGQELGRKVWSDWTGRDVNLYKQAPEVYDQNMPGIRAVSRVLTYLASNVLSIPVAGGAAELLCTSSKNFRLCRNEYLQPIMISLVHWAVSHHATFDAHYQRLITILGNWTGRDPIGTARDDLRRFLIEIYGWVGDLEKEDIMTLKTVVDGLNKQRAESPTSTTSTNSGSHASTNETSFSSEAGLDGLEDPSEQRNAPSTDEGKSAKSAPVTSEAWADQGSSLTGDSLTQPLLGDYSPGNEGDGEATYVDMGGNDGVLLFAQQERARKHPWTRFKEWLFGKTVPESLKPLVQQIRSGKPLGQLPGDSAA